MAGVFYDAVMSCHLSADDDSSSVLHHFELKRPKRCVIVTDVAYYLDNPAVSAEAILDST
jgi:hypothetical protein